MAGAKRRIIFVVGGARSGKSSFAMKEASKAKGRKAYIAPAEALDLEMEKRIERHKAERGKDWDTFEEPLKIAGVIKEAISDYDAVVVDCLTLWLSNILHSNLNADYEIENLITALRSVRNTSSIYVVSNEVGTGIVPDNELARKFRDLAGILNAKVAAISDAAYLTVAGMAIKVK
jgi:adenosylcobinamide kinase/adenosylcobinamide-phosphate guanylyltransferase